VALSAAVLDPVKLRLVLSCQNGSPSVSPLFRSLAGAAGVPPIAHFLLFPWRLGLAACAAGAELSGRVPLPSATPSAGARFWNGLHPSGCWVVTCLLCRRFGASASFHQLTLLLLPLAACVGLPCSGLAVAAAPGGTVAALAARCSVCVLRSAPGRARAHSRGLVVMGSVAVTPLLHGRKPVEPNSWWLGCFLPTWWFGVSLWVLRSSRARLDPCGSLDCSASLAGVPPLPDRGPCGRRVPGYTPRFWQRLENKFAAFPGFLGITPENG